MATPYEEIYSNLLPKFRSYEIPFMTTDEVKDFLHDYLIPATTRFIPTYTPHLVVKFYVVWHQLYGFSGR